MTTADEMQTLQMARCVADGCDPIAVIVVGLRDGSLNVYVGMDSSIATDREAIATVADAVAKTLKRAPMHSPGEPHNEAMDR